MTDIHRRACVKSLELLHARACTSTGLSANGNHIVTGTRSDMDTSKHAASTVLHSVTSLEDIGANWSAVQRRSGFQVLKVAKQALHRTNLEVVKKLAWHSSSICFGRA